MACCNSKQLQSGAFTVEHLPPANVPGLLTPASQVVPFVCCMGEGLLVQKFWVAWVEGVWFKYF